MEITKATLNDIAQMQKLVEPEIKSGIILPRSDDEVATNIRSYILVKLDNLLIGFLALHIHTLALAEIRSAVVAPVHRKKGVARAMIEAAFIEAKSLKIDTILVLTYNESLFVKMGFANIPKERLPEHKIWADCIKCQHFPQCDEVSLIKKL